MINEDNWESSTDQNMIFYYYWSKYFVWLYPLPSHVETIEKSKNVKQIILMNVQFLYRTLLLKEYTLLRQSTDSSLEQNKWNFALLKKLIIE